MVKSKVKDSKEKRSTLRAIASYIYIWPSIRKYATYIYMFFTGKKDKKKYDYWEED